MLVTMVHQCIVVNLLLGCLFNAAYCVQLGSSRQCFFLPCSDLHSTFLVNMYMLCLLTGVHDTQLDRNYVLYSTFLIVHAEGHIHLNECCAACSVQNSTFKGHKFNSC